MAEPSIRPESSISHPSAHRGAGGYCSQFEMAREEGRDRIARLNGKSHKQLALWLRKGRYQDDFRFLRVPSGRRNPLVMLPAALDCHQAKRLVYWEACCPGGRVRLGVIMPNNPATIGRYRCGPGEPLLVIAGPCVIESEALTLEIAQRLKQLAAELPIQLVFKASFDKANRTSASAFRGLGLQAGLAVLHRVREVTGLP